MILLLLPPRGHTGRCLVVSARGEGDASGIYYEEARDAAHIHRYNVQNGLTIKNNLVQNVDSAEIEKRWPGKTLLHPEQK